MQTAVIRRLAMSGGSIGGKVDEVEVFGMFGGDLPAAHPGRKLKGKRTRATGLTRFQQDASTITDFEHETRERVFNWR